VVESPRFVAVFLHSVARWAVLGRSLFLPGLALRASATQDVKACYGCDDSVLGMLKQATKRTSNGSAHMLPLHVSENANDGVGRWVDRLRAYIRPFQAESLQALLAAVDAKDHYTRRHSMTVAAYAEAIGRRMKLSRSVLRTLGVAALLHDVGKIGVPDRILNKPGPLDADELEIMRRHPQIAIDILGPMRFLVNHRPIILHHHERYDGDGYPGKLLAGQIPLGARILAVADAVDTMLSPRTYKEPFPLDEVRAELIRGAGKQFDSHVVGTTLDWLDSFVLGSGAVTSEGHRDNRRS